jgi:membrane protease YdiL (CAAX protease family)
MRTLTHNRDFFAMSTIDTAYSLPQANALPAQAFVRDALTAPGPWGFWASTGWGLFAAAAGLVAVFVYTIIWMLTHGLRLANAGDPAYATATGILLLSAPIVVLVIAAKARKFSLRSYFALEGFSGRSLALGFFCLVALIVAFGTLQTLLGTEGGAKYMETTYRAAKAAGVLPLMWLLIVVVAPVTEELFFRGFLHRGWAPSWLGISGTIVVTAALWALLHQQYNALGILFIFAMGLILGWLRQRSGSTLLPMALHAINNLWATGFTAIYVEWLS